MRQFWKSSGEQILTHSNMEVIPIFPIQSSESSASNRLEANITYAEAHDNWHSLEWFASQFSHLLWQLEDLTQGNKIPRLEVVLDHIFYQFIVRICMVIEITSLGLLASSEPWISSATFLTFSVMLSAVSAPIWHFSAGARWPSQPFLTSRGITGWLGK